MEIDFTDQIKNSKVKVADSSSEVKVDSTQENKVTETKAYDVPVIGMADVEHQLLCGHCGNVVARLVPRHSMYVNEENQPKEEEKVVS